MWTTVPKHVAVARLLYIYIYTNTNTHVSTDNIRTLNVGWRARGYSYLCEYVHLGMDASVNSQKANKSHSLIPVSFLAGIDVANINY